VGSFLSLSSLKRLDGVGLGESLEELSELGLISIWREALHEKVASLLGVLELEDLLGELLLLQSFSDVDFLPIDFLFVHFLDGLGCSVGVLEAHEGEEFVGNLRLVRVDLLDEDGLQLAELFEHLGQVSLPVLEVVGAVDLGFVLLEALDDDVVEDLAHLSLGLGVVLVEHHLILGIRESFQDRI